MLTSNDVIESIEFQPKQNDKSVPMDDANGRQFNLQMANGINEE